MSVSEGGLPKWSHEVSPDQPLPGSQSCPISPLKPLQSDETVVYSALSRPLPAYSLESVFAQCGPGEAAGRGGGVLCLALAPPDWARAAVQMD